MSEMIKLDKLTFFYPVEEGRSNRAALDGVDLREKMLTMIEGMIPSAVNSFVPQEEGGEYPYDQLRQKLIS